MAASSVCLEHCIVLLCVLLLDCPCSLVQLTLDSGVHLLLIHKLRSGGKKVEERKQELEAWVGWSALGLRWMFDKAWGIGSKSTKISSFFALS